MKSSSFIFIVLVSFAFMVVPSQGRASSHSNIVAPSTPVAEISMESFRAGVLDRQDALNLANTNLTAGQYQNAAEVLGKLLISYPDDEDVMRKAIWAYEVTGQPEKTLPLYDLLLKRHTEDTCLALSAARTYSWTGQFTVAEKLYDGLIKKGVDSCSGVTGDIIMAEYADVLFKDKQFTDAALYYSLLWKKGVLGQQKQQNINFVHTLIAMGENDAAADQLESLAQRYSDDIEVLQATADVSFALKAYDKAAILYRELIVKKPDSPLFYNKLADIEMVKKDYADAIKISHETLLHFPENEIALLMIARVSSWQKDYSTSLAYYDTLIALNYPDKDKYYREKARVLGWMTEYDKSLAVYNDAIHLYPENKVLKTEAEAKKDYYHQAYRSAVRSYKSWLAVNTEQHQPDALFDLAQLYMQYGRWKEAIEMYDVLLKAIPYHQLAVLGKQKAEIISSMTCLRTGVEYFSAQSAENVINGRQTNVTYTDFYTALSHPLQEQLLGFVNLDSKSYNFHTISPVTHGITAGLEYSNLPDILFRTAYGVSQTSSGLPDRHTGFLETESLPLDNLHIGFSFHRDDVISNIKTFDENLQTNRWQGRVFYDGYRAWNAGVDYALNRYSDGNSSVTAGVDITAHLFYDPQRLNITYRLQSYGFSEYKPDYWAPSSFTTHTVGLEWQHYLNEERSFGANETYYTAAFRLSLEPGGNVSHQVYAGLHHDWSNRFSSFIEYQHTWDTTSAIYSDRMLKAEIQWFF